MKTKPYFVGLYAVLFFSVFLRIFQVFNNTNQVTGFFYNSKPVFYLIIDLIIVLLFCGTAFMIKRCPIKMPRVSVFMSISSFIAAISLLVRSFAIYLQNGISIRKPLGIIGIVLNFLLAVFFVLYSSKKFIRFHIKRIFYVLPLFYWLATLINSYIRISKLSLISENTLLVLASVTTTLFMLYFVKTANGMASNKNDNRFLLFFGSLSSVFCISFSVPQIYVILNGAQKTIHNDLSLIIVFLTTGLFVLSFIHAFFNENNLIKKHHKNEDSGKILSTDLKLIVDSQKIENSEENN